MVIAQLSLAQSGYPKRILFDGDTVIAFLDRQVNLVNYNKVSYDECSEIKASYSKEVSLLKKSLVAEKLATEKLQENISLLQDIESEKDFQIQELKNDGEKKDKRIKLLRSCRVPIAVGCLAVGFFVGNRIRLN